MTFEELLILVERNNFMSKVDFTIAIKLFDAENDCLWNQLLMDLLKIIK